MRGLAQAIKSLRATPEMSNAQYTKPSFRRVAYLRAWIAECVRLFRLLETPFGVLLLEIRVRQFDARRLRTSGGSIGNRPRRNPLILVKSKETLVNCVRLPLACTICSAKLHSFERSGGLIPSC